MPWKIAFEPVSLSCFNSVIYGSSLRTDGMVFFFQDLECIEYLLSVETCNFKRCKCKDWEEEKVKCWHWESFPVLSLFPLLKGETKVEWCTPNYMNLVYNFGGWHKQIQHSSSMFVWIQYVSRLIEQTALSHPTGLQCRGDSVQKPFTH